MLRLDDRYRRHWDERLPPWQAFDPSDPAHVDAMAGVLFERFCRSGDVEAFALLTEVTRPCLEQTAATIVERFGASVPPADLMENLRRHLFQNRGRDGAGFASSHFLAYARGHLVRLANHPLDLAAGEGDTFPDECRDIDGGRCQPGEGRKMDK